MELTTEHVSRMRELHARHNAWIAAGRVDGDFPEADMTELIEMLVAFQGDLLDCAGAITGELEMHAASRLLGTGVTNLVGRHELEDHEGERCVVERANALAYLAHRIGAGDAETLALMIERVRDYRAFHEEMHPEHEHLH